VCWSPLSEPCCPNTDKRRLLINLEMAVSLSIDKLVIYSRDCKKKLTLNVTRTIYMMPYCRLQKNSQLLWQCWYSKFNYKSSCIQVYGSVDADIVAYKFRDHLAKA